jgi:hypothetical protein
MLLQTALAAETHLAEGLDLEIMMHSKNSAAANNNNNKKKKNTETTTTKTIFIYFNSR